MAELTPGTAIQARSSAAQIDAAARRLADGGLVAFPTETVYGLGARADEDTAVAAIFAAKGRPANHPLIVHLASAAMASEFAEAPNDDAAKLMRAFWPGPLTLILPRRPGRGQAAAGGQDSIGLRVPSHPTALALLKRAAELGVPGMAGPSANRFGRISPTTAAHVRQELGPDLMVLDGGACQVGIESTIVDCTRAQPALLRPGQLSVHQLQAVLGKTVIAASADAPRAPGTLASHYAPSAKLRLLPTNELRQRLQDAAAQGYSKNPGQNFVGVYSRTAFAEEARALHREINPGQSSDFNKLPLQPPPSSASRDAFVFKPMPANAEAAAQALFAALREFDSAGMTEIWVETPPPEPQWAGVIDRLQRAAA